MFYRLVVLTFYVTTQLLHLEFCDLISWNRLSIATKTLSTITQLLLILFVCFGFKGAFQGTQCPWWCIMTYFNQSINQSLIPLLIIKCEVTSQNSLLNHRPHFFRPLQCNCNSFKRTEIRINHCLSKLWAPRQYFY